MNQGCIMPRSPHGQKGQCVSMPHCTMKTHKVKQTRQSTALTSIETPMQRIYWWDGGSDGWTLDVDVALLWITIDVDVQHATELMTLANDVVHQRRFPPATSTLSTLTNTHIQQSAIWRTSELAAGYATWFTTGGAIYIAHYDVIDDVITQKL